jgi:hypothetical protein
MANIDFKVSADLQELFELPACEDLRLPPPEKLEITLPTGGTLKAMADISKGIPNDCSLIVSLMLQIAPFLAGIECLLKVLGLIAPLVDVVKALVPAPDALKLGRAVPKFLEAADKVMPCLLVLTGAPIIPFLRDLLCLILKVLHCLQGQLQNIIDIMNGLTPQIKLAIAEGNTELQQALECALENAGISAQHSTASLEPILTILQLAAPLMELAGVPPLQLPPLGSENDVRALQLNMEILQEIEGIIQVAVDGLGGCSA